MSRWEDLTRSACVMPLVALRHVPSFIRSLTLGRGRKRSPYSIIRLAVSSVVVIFFVYYLFVHLPQPVHYSSPLRAPSLLADPICLIRQTGWSLGYMIKRDKSPCSEVFMRHVVTKDLVERGWEKRTLGAYRAEEAKEGEGRHPILTGECFEKEDCPVVWVSMGSRCSKGFNRLAANLQSAGIPLAIIGYPDRWKGFGHRIRLYHDYLLTLPDDSLVILSDGDDVIFARCDIKEVEEAYKRLNTSVVFTAEPYCWPYTSIWSQYPEVPPPPPTSAGHRSGSRYLNAGTVIGTAAALREFLAHSYNKGGSECADDQGAFTYTFLERLELLGGDKNNPNWQKMGVTLDYYQDIFMSLQATVMADLKVDVRAGRVRNRLTGGNACILHQNGNKDESQILEALVERLGVNNW
ncbi:uncharacterized protein SPPG_01122 [Spizellomyces punctatus DAOM BR117]|uniref:PLOD1-3-like GT domain-containing protein n=1 Tax=Spizellomyces punctatus (strain DAOM BR117) TaxID=645134 RepID=A0A0L0HRY1_SPIPD|nr:uncharacterized protein SPPG_01122 [Spizellomyces punctatus DAOM BR117]KND03650.1 hypothetical protein SPPG_01122 [Spizellomyces punctatus DAOM BR117]|eukprot:XP_016611689.1 hypothetical protein SPPG_01122 [Spizellomyces punctatus DAOM BR117]